MIILLKYCTNVKNYEKFQRLWFYVYILFKYCAVMKNCESFRNFDYIYNELFDLFIIYF